MLVARPHSSEPMKNTAVANVRADFRPNASDKRPSVDQKIKEEEERKKWSASYFFFARESITDRLECSVADHVRRSNPHSVIGASIRERERDTTTLRRQVRCEATNVGSVPPKFCTNLRVYGSDNG